MRPGSWSTSAAWFLVGVLTVTTLSLRGASAGTEPQQFTGCLSKGRFLKVALGDEPSSPCSVRAGETQVSWSSGSGGSGDLVITKATLGAPTASADVRAEAADLVIGSDSIVWTPSSSDVVDPCPYNMSGRPCYVATVPFDPGPVVDGGVATALVVSGTFAASSLEGSPPEDCLWQVFHEPDSAMFGGGTFADVDFIDGYLGAVSRPFKNLFFVDEIRRIALTGQCYPTNYVLPAGFTVSVTGLEIRLISFGKPLI